MSDQQGPPGIDLDVASMSIGILGGTGAEGRGLAHRFALAGNPVIIGSRSAERAAAAAQGLGGELGIRGMVNADAAESADVVIVAVPWDGHAALLASLAAPLAAALLPDSVVVGAFHHVSAVLLLDPALGEVDQDVLVLGDNRQATDLVEALAARIPGVRGVYAGRLRNCGQIEALTANLVSINRRYKAHAGLRVTDI